MRPPSPTPPEARYPLHEPFCCFLGSAYVHAGFLGAYQTLQTGVTQAVSHALEVRLALPLPLR